ncbi:MAG: glycosyltransferase [bacterium]
MGYNILHVNTARTWRGGEQQLVYLVEGLRDRGHNNFVACQPNSILAEKLSSRGVTVITLPMRGEWDIFAAVRLAKIIRRHNIQIIHLHTAHAHTLGSLAARMTPSCKVIVSRRVDFHIHSSVKYKLGIDRIIAVSEGIKSVLVKDGVPAGKIAVIYDGVDLSKFNNLRSADYLYREFALKKGTPVIGIVAALAPHKHHQNFLAAAKIVKGEFPAARFLIVGEGELKKELKELCRKLELYNEVIFCGFREDIPELISIFDIFVLSSYLEGMGSSLLEAMALAKPIVATNTGGIPEVVKHDLNGLLVPPRDSEALAKAIIDLLKDEEKRKEMGLEGRDMIREFSTAQMIEGTLKVYEEVIEL